MNDRKAVSLSILREGQRVQLRRLFLLKVDSENREGHAGLSVY